ncbi:baseplate J/gp47 family protein [Clostridium botulinum]|nr:baseplate J/gp47 family protein [Clostridium botulinum]NFO48532.1 baseplate J/gp47 family protein [Clostridium botulinum]NFO54868.1 baseplate J/gp47 family protein [Clostridium botulinum]
MFFKSAEDYYKEMTSTLKDVNISKKSLVYNSLMPCCYELSYQSMMLDEVTKMVFASSALENKYSKCLERRCSEEISERKKATIATGTIKIVGKKKAKLPQKTLVATSLGITYITQEEVILDDSGIGYVGIIAEKEGSKYNADVGEICCLLVKYEGILSIINEEKITNGYDQESDEDLYNRYLLKIRTPATSGNDYHYKQWCLETEGCGSAKVYPLWNGNGTVKCVISNSNKRAASKELIDKVKQHIEEVRPIGATVTVVSVEELLLNVSVSLIYNSKEITLDKIKENIKSSIEEYLKKVALNINYISIAKIGALILSSDGVEDYNNLTINGSTNNVTVNDNQIAVLGEVVCNAT